MSDLPVTPPPRTPNDYPQGERRTEVQSKERTRPLCGYIGTTRAPKREDYFGR